MFSALLDKLVYSFELYWNRLEVISMKSLRISITIYMKQIKTAKHNQGSVILHEIEKKT